MGAPSAVRDDISRHEACWVICGGVGRLQLVDIRMKVLVPESDQLSFRSLPKRFSHGSRDLLSMID